MVRVCYGIYALTSGENRGRDEARTAERVGFLARNSMRNTFLRTYARYLIQHVLLVGIGRGLQARRKQWRSRWLEKKKPVASWLW
jgi:hypothetical protein